MPFPVKKIIPGQGRGKVTQLAPGKVDGPRVLDKRRRSRTRRKSKAAQRKTKQRQ